MMPIVSINKFGYIKSLAEKLNLKETSKISENHDANEFLEVPLR